MRPSGAESLSHLSSEFQSTHPLRGATASVLYTRFTMIISIHAPLAGCDLEQRLSKGGNKISIHAPLAGCDRSVGAPACPSTYFNPRTPCGVRPKPKDNQCRYSNFNPRTPCGVRHQLKELQLWFQEFQSTHPLRGATRANALPVLFERNFNPRTPCGVRLSTVSGEKYVRDFNPRTPCGVRPSMGD